MKTAEHATVAVRHLLDPLTADEIEAASRSGRTRLRKQTRSIGSPLGVGFVNPVRGRCYQAEC